MRGADDLVCKDKSLKCCHESSLKEANTDTSSQEDDYYDQEYCENVFEDGYRYDIFAANVFKATLEVSFGSKL